MAGYIGTKAVALSTTTGNILGDMTVGGTTDVATLEFNSLSGTGSVTITDILDEDNLASNSATKLATQQSIKAYVDSQVDTVDTLAEILAIGNRTSGTGKIEFRDAAIFINSSTDGQLDIVADTEIQIAATTVDLNGNLDVSGTALVTGVLTTAAPAIINTASNGLPSLAFSHSNGSADNFLIGAGIPGTSNSGFAIRDVDASANRFVIDSSGEIGIGIDVPLHALHINASEDAAIPTNAGVGVTAAHQSYFGFHNISNSATYSGIALETRTSGAARWLIANEWKDTYLGDLVFRARSGGSASAERFRIKSNGFIGINTAAPAAPLQVDSDNGFPGIILSRDGGVSGRRPFGMGLGGNTDSTMFINASNDTTGAGAFGGSRVVLMELEAAGNVTVKTGSLIIDSGNLVIGTAGRGIDFSAQTATSASGASTSAEVLDHYEEGTFTAVLTAEGSAPNSAISAACNYVRIGNVIHTFIRFSNANTAGASGTMIITGLPYASANTVEQQAATPMMHNLTVSEKYVTAYISGNRTTINFLNIRNNAAWTNVAINASTGVYMNFNISYRVA